MWSRPLHSSIGISTSSLLDCGQRGMGLRVEGSVERSGNPWCITGRGVGWVMGVGVGRCVCFNPNVGVRPHPERYSRIIRHVIYSQTYSRVVSTSNGSLQAVGLVTLFRTIGLLSWFSLLFEPQEIQTQPLRTSIRMPTCYQLHHKIPRHVYWNRSCLILSISKIATHIVTHSVHYK